MNGDSDSEFQSIAATKKKSFTKLKRKSERK